MAEWGDYHFEEMVTALRDGPEAIPTEHRRRLATNIADAILCHDAGSDPVIADLVALLSGDPDWTVRLEVARLIHMLDDEACSRYVALFRTDCNSYVRSHAERSLARQRKARRTSSRKRSDCRGYAEQVDQLTRQYGKRLAGKVSRAGGSALLNARRRRGS